MGVKLGRTLYGVLMVSLFATLLSSANVSAEGVFKKMPTAMAPTWKIFKEGTGRSVMWKTHKPNRRFAIYDPGTSGDPMDDLVLDGETGLVWERSPGTTDFDWYAAIDLAFNKILGGRKGWRLPTAEELASLVDVTSGLNTGQPTLPAGHPFIGVQLRAYWTSTTYAADPNRAWDVFFADGNVNNGKDKGVNTGLVWAVRGGQGHDGF